MAFLEIKNVRIAGMSTAFPKRIVNNKKLLEERNIEEESALNFVRQVGIIERRESLSVTESDLACVAIEKLLADLNWEKESIEAILCVSLTPDYPLPVNACIIQDRVGFSKECYAQDISMGCSGWVYGLSVVASMLKNGDVKRALLLSGDSKMVWGTGNNELLFGHCCNVTAVEYEPGSEGFKFNYGTDGSGYDAIIMPKSGMRNANYSMEEIKKFEDPFIQHSMQAEMKSLDVFAFSISRVPKQIELMSEHFGFDYHDFDYFILHQANKSINQHILKKLKIAPEKSVSSIECFGNTLSASIPVTITTQLKDKLRNEKKRIMCCGFGVGLSWGLVTFTADNIVISDMIEVEENSFNEKQWV